LLFAAESLPAKTEISKHLPSIVEHCSLLRLTETYRSTQNILGLVAALVGLHNVRTVREAVGVMPQLVHLEKDTHEANVSQHKAAPVAWRATSESRGIPTAFHLFQKDGKLVRKSVLGIYSAGALTSDGNLLPVNADAIAANLSAEIKRFWMSTINVDVNFSAVQMLPGESSLSAQHGYLVSCLEQLTSRLHCGSRLHARLACLERKVDPLLQSLGCGNEAASCSTEAVPSSSLMMS